MLRSTILLAFFLHPVSVVVSQESATTVPEAKIETAVKDNQGALVHVVTSGYQSAATEIRVLLPDKLEAKKRHPVVYVLPVEAGRESRFGDGLEEIRKLDLHNMHAAVFVAPTFAALPWYADHATDARLRQETYFLKVVMPFVEKTYPALATPEGRLLLGFSKSGWGAWTLLLRHGDTFGKAAAWDAPLMMDKLGSFGTTEIFGDQENFQRYRPADLLKTQAGELRGDARLILTGFGNFRDHHVRARKLLDELKVPYIYRDGPQRKHDWHSGWVAEAVGLLLQPPGE